MASEELQRKLVLLKSNLTTSWKRETKLLESSDSEEEDTSTSNLTSSKALAINKDYASRYENWRGKEEIQKLKDKFGNSVLERRGGSDSESSSSESEEELEAALNDKEFLKTLSHLKKKDPIIYDGASSFFSEKEEVVESNEKTKLKPKKKTEEKKPFLLKDHEREMILNINMEKDVEEDEVLNEDVEMKAAPVTKSYFEEQDSIKKGIKSAVQAIHSESEEDDESSNNLLKERKKSSKEMAEEEEDYKKWLSGKVEKLEDDKISKDDKKELAFLRDYWTNPKLNEGEQFLRDYILNRKYVEKVNSDYIPTYDEIVHDSDEEGLSGDEAKLEQTEEFEQKYNFRFEEPDIEFIKKYPRTVQNSIRRKENKRKTDRERLRESKKKEKERKLAEIQQLKAFSRKKILEKIRLLQTSSGDTNIDFTEEDVSGDFDPEAYDNRSKQIFNEEFYSNCVDEEKPVFSDMELDEEDDDIKFKDDVVHLEDPPENGADALENGDLDVDLSSAEAKLEPSTSSSSKKSSNNKLKGRKAKRFLETLEKQKSNMNPEERKKLQDEYYKLDFEDVVGDLPCRFKYREVIPNDFGLTTEEILNAEDQELNRWSSIKKTYLYRSNEEELYDKHAYEVKRADFHKKKRLLASIYDESQNGKEEEESDEETPTDGPTKKKNRKKNKKKKVGNGEAASEVKVKQEIDEPQSIPKPNPTTSTTDNPTKSRNAMKKLRKKLSQRAKKLEQNGGANTNSESTVATTVPPPAKSSTSSAKSGGDKKKWNKNSNSKAAVPPTNADRLSAYGINPKKYEKWVKYGKDKDTTTTPGSMSTDAKSKGK